MADTFLQTRLRQIKFDGANGQRPKKLLVNLLKMAAACEEGGSVEDCEAAHAALLKDIALYDFSMGKIQVVADTNLREVQAYKELQGSLTADMGRLSAEIETLKTRVAHERVVRKNKEEYAVLAKQVEKHPARSQTQKDQEQLNEQLATLEHSTQQHEAVMKTRKRQLALLLHEVEHLKKTALETEDDIAGVPDVTSGGEGGGGGDVEMGGA